MEKRQKGAFGVLSFMKIPLVSPSLDQKEQNYFAPMMIGHFKRKKFCGTQSTSFEPLIISFLKIVSQSSISHDRPCHAAFRKIIPHSIIYSSATGMTTSQLIGTTFKMGWSSISSSMISEKLTILVRNTTHVQWCIMVLMLSLRYLKTKAI